MNHTDHDPLELRERAVRLTQENGLISSIFGQDL